MRDLPAHEYHSTQERWLTPDPAGLAAVDLANPQTLNRYAYVMENPLSFTDSTGMWCDERCGGRGGGGGYDEFGSRAVAATNILDLPEEVQISIDSEIRSGMTLANRLKTKRNQ